MNRIPLYAIVDSEPGQGRPRLLVLENQWMHLFRALAYSWQGRASIEERIFGADDALRQSRLREILRKVWKKARRVVGILTFVALVGLTEYWS
jgi:hypothetical protein